MSSGVIALPLTALGPPSRESRMARNPLLGYCAISRIYDFVMCTEVHYEPRVLVARSILSANATPRRPPGRRLRGQRAAIATEDQNRPTAPDAPRECGMMGQRGESAWATTARVQGRSSGFSASPPTGTEAGGLFPL